MTLDEIDKTGLILESYRIEGIQPADCRSIFLDWALKLSPGSDTSAAIELLITAYGRDNPEHPMTKVLHDGLRSPSKTGRRGGRRARFAASTDQY